MTDSVYDSEEELLSERLRPIILSSSNRSSPRSYLSESPPSSPQLDSVNQGYHQPRVDPALTVLINNATYVRNDFHEQKFTLSRSSSPPILDMPESTAQSAPPHRSLQRADDASLISPVQNSAIDPSLAAPKQTVEHDAKVTSDANDGDADGRDLAAILRVDSVQTGESGSQSAHDRASGLADAETGSVAARKPDNATINGDLPERSALRLHTSSIDTHAPASRPETTVISPDVAKIAALAQAQTTDLTSPHQEGATNTPPRERLPSFSQLTHSLPALAEAATQEARSQQAYAHHHSQSCGSIPPQSPLLASHPQSATTQTSPVAYNTYPASISARSPTSALSDGPYYGSPQGYPGYNYYAQRRPSAVAAAEGGAAMPPSLPSASSSGESQGAAGSSVDGYSTTQTTPVDPTQAAESTPRASMVMLPPPPLMIPGGYKCDYSGCNAPPFQTQYLLTSHRNVHSQNRPHYCPMKDCPRSEGGRGFKRKNEMIRHGLVHSSPGYICPFCPEREHKYPRPDNLQRHVRVHHVDKDRDDPALREVLNQRNEGHGKTRRRRTTMGGITSA